MWESDISTRVKYMHSIHLPSLPFPPQQYIINIKGLHHLRKLRT